MPSDFNAAAERAAGLLDVAPEGESGEEEAAAEDVPQDAAEPEESPAEEHDPFGIPDLPDDLRAELEAAEIDAQIPEEPDLSDEPEEWVDPDDELAELRAKLAQAEKERTWLKQQRAQSERAKWIKEAEKYFPFSNATKIEADSRRSFLKKAQAEHESVKPHVLAERERLTKELEGVREKATAEARAEAEKAWGKPTATVGATPPKPERRRQPSDRDGNLRKLEKSVFNRMWGDGSEGGDEAA